MFVFRSVADSQNGIIVTKYVFYFSVIILRNNFITRNVYMRCSQFTPEIHT